MLNDEEQALNEALRRALQCPICGSDCIATHPVGSFEMEAEDALGIGECKVGHMYTLERHND